MTVEPYQGFEQGPFKSPSEANSLSFRITRNCPWNRCAFCSLFEGQSFQARPVEHVVNDIDVIHKHVDALLKVAGGAGIVSRDDNSTTIFLKNAEHPPNG